LEDRVTQAAITANRLADGEVVFWSDGRWVERFADAELFDDPDEMQASLGQATMEVTTVVDVYPIDLTLQDGVPVPTSYRERVRALGPTIHPEMGKQAEGGRVVEAIAAASGAARSSGRLGLIRRK
jgi:hypothetical protein